MTDSVELWKRIAEAGVEREALDRKRGATIRFALSPVFFLYLFLLGLPLGKWGPAAMSALVLSVLLVQEFPRALFARRCGHSATISISHHGTDTQLTGASLRGGAAFAFAALGSAANLAIAGVAALLARRAHAPALSSALVALALAHAVWGLAQALPMLPFRAGAAISARLTPSGRFAHALASLVGVVVLALAARSSGRSALLLMPLATLTTLAVFWATLQAYRQASDERSGIRIAAEKAEAFIAAGKPQLGSALATEALGLARLPSERVRLEKVLAWAAIGRQDPVAAHFALERLPLAALDVHLVASYLACCNRLEEATALIERARKLGHRSPASTKVLLDAYYRRGDLHAVRELARADRELLPAADRETIEAALATARG